MFPPVTEVSAALGLVSLKFNFYAFAHVLQSMFKHPLTPGSTASMNLSQRESLMKGQERWKGPENHQLYSVLFLKYLQRGD